MAWRSQFDQCSVAVELEKDLNPKLIEHYGDLKSTANTDVENKIIHLDVTQPDLKCALSYVYELKNLENAPKYAEIINNAKKHLIPKSRFIKDIIKLEAEAVHFRCQVFKELGADQSVFPCRKDYLDLYERTKNLPKEIAIKQFAQFIEDHGLVRREYAAKKFYADSYDFYAKDKSWPRFYDVPTVNPPIPIQEVKLESEIPSSIQEEEQAPPAFGA